MAENENFLPKFELSGNLSNDLRSLKIAEALSEGWYKGSIDYHLREIGAVIMIDGEEYYGGFGMLYNTDKFSVKGTRDYHIAEFLKLIGFEDADLRQINQTAHSKGVDGLDQRWIAKDDITPDWFRKYVENIEEDLKNIDTIEVDYELQRYKKSVYPTESSRVYNSRSSLFGDRLQWGAGQQNFGSERWTLDGRILEMTNIQTKHSSLAFGKAIRFKSAGVDVTSSLDPLLTYAVQSMIAYSGSDFMEKLSESKTGEIHYDVEQWATGEGGGATTEYVSVVGTEVYNANIKNSFVLDSEEKHYKRYTSFRGVERRDITENRIPLNERIMDGFRDTGLFHYAKPFWDYTKYASYDESSRSVKHFKPRIHSGDEFLFKDSGRIDIGVYMRVSAFRKLSMKDIGFYFGNYFDIRVSQRSGGFFSGFIGAIANFLGKIFDLTINIEMKIPPFRLAMQMFTKVVNALFGSDLTAKEVIQISAQVAWIIIGAVLSIVTFGASLAISVAIALSIAGSKANEQKKEAEEKSNKTKQEQEERKKQREIKAKQDKESQKFDTGAEEQEKEKFQAFLKDPLFQFETDLKKIDSDMKSQFKLI